MIVGGNMNLLSMLNSCLAKGGGEQDTNTIIIGIGNGPLSMITQKQISISKVESKIRWKVRPKGNQTGVQRFNLKSEARHAFEGHNSRISVSRARWRKIRMRTADGLRIEYDCNKYLANCERTTQIE